MSTNNTGLITFDSSGLKIATFAEIKEYIKTQIRLAYGQDVDLSDDVPDGIFVNNLALMYNDMFNTILTLYTSFNPLYAQGVMLDNIAAFNNLKRKSATYSTAVVRFSNNSDEFSYNFPAGTKLLDKQSNVWNTLESFELSSSESFQVEVVCETAGVLNVPAGNINSLMSPIAFITVTNPTNGVSGRGVESDFELKNRRALTFGVNAFSTKDSIITNLLKITGVQDVKLYNNDTLADIKAGDNNDLNLCTVIEAHSIYVLVRIDDTISRSSTTYDSIVTEIGATLYNYKTAGTHTTSPLSTNNNVIKEQVSLIVDENPQLINFSVAILNPTLILYVDVIRLEGYSEDYELKMKESIGNYLSSLPIGTYSATSDLFIPLLEADPKPNQLPTYQIRDISTSAGGGISMISNPDNYFSNSRDYIEERVVIRYV